jgi:ERCC4-type nuclease
MLLVAPSEHDVQALLRSYVRSPKEVLHKISSLPERHGCDFLYIQSTGILGFQRKTLSDLSASLIDGRLHYELDQIEASATLSLAFLILESPLTRTTSGELFDAPVSMDTIRSLTVKLAARRMGVLLSSNPEDTIRCILGTAKYVRSPSFDQTARPKQLKNAWGTVDSDAYALFLLQSFPNIGPKQARAIYDHFHGVPIAWTVTVEQLMEVKGIGRKTALSLVAALRLD